MKKRIAVLVNKYPNPLEPNACVFIQQLIWTFADCGYECSVICPMPINIKPKAITVPFSREEVNENGEKIRVYHPKYLSLGQSGSALQKQRVKFTTFMYQHAVDRVLKKMDRMPDFLYSHFLCPSGVVASRLGKKYRIPAYMAHGEAIYAGNETYGNTVLAKELTGLNGVVAVSSQNKGYVVDAGIVPESRVQVFPNGFRPERFYPRDKVEARNKFGWDQDDFIVGMCGSLDERKGVNRLQAAVDQIPDAWFACAGKGPEMPTSDKCVWKSPVNNADLPWYYSALDVFVMPTQNEGCCNAIVEAIACGCPIVSSDRSFNVDICDASNSILVDPDDVPAIRDAVIQLKEDPQLRARLAAGSTEKAKSLHLRSRAERILAFMEERRESWSL